MAVSYEDRRTCICTVGSVGQLTLAREYCITERYTHAAERSHRTGLIAVSAFVIVLGAVEYSNDAKMSTAACANIRVRCAELSRMSTPASQAEPRVQLNYTYRCCGSKGILMRLQV